MMRQVFGISNITGVHSGSSSLDLRKPPYFFHSVWTEKTRHVSRLGEFLSVESLAANVALLSLAFTWYKVTGKQLLCNWHIELTVLCLRLLPYIIVSIILCSSLSFSFSLSLLSLHLSIYLSIYIYIYIYIFMHISISHSLTSDQEPTITSNFQNLIFPLDFFTLSLPANTTTHPHSQSQAHFLHSMQHESLTVWVVQGP